MMNKPLMAGNWKMYKTPTETQHFFEKFNALVAAVRHCEILICPPALDLTTAIAATIDNNVAIGRAESVPGKGRRVHRGDIRAHDQVRRLHSCFDRT